ncbi:hypothetical protein DNTS_023126, partial [Danionella cerebrum]
MADSSCLTERWRDENNNVVLAWKQNERRLRENFDDREKCFSGCHKLLQKMQGIPAATERLKLEMTVSYNTLLFSVGLSSPAEIQKTLDHSLLRALGAAGSPVMCADPGKLWEAVLETFVSSEFLPCVHKLLLVQWMLSLIQCQSESILGLLAQADHKREHSAPANLVTETRNLALRLEEDASLMVAMASKDLKDLLHICTVIYQGVEQMTMEKYSDALNAFQEAKELPSPRSLLAQIYTLTGQSFAKLDQPQCALHYFRKAVEVDCACHSAIYQSTLVFRKLGNPKAEMEALNLLYSAVQLECNNSSPSTSLVSPALLLGGEQMTFMSRVPSPSLILHSLAHSLFQRVLSTILICWHHCSQISKILVPVVYLEAGFALIKSERYSDALVVCDEVVTNTFDFIPDKLLLDPSDKQVSETVLESLDFVLWAGAAHLLQANAHWKLKDTKEAITSFTRAINQLVKVFVKQKDWKQQHLRSTEVIDEKLLTLEVSKAQALAGRGVCFLERDQLKEALRDLHLSLQMSPDCNNTEKWLAEVLWRLDRREEASVHWRKAHTSDAIIINVCVLE